MTKILSFLMAFVVLGALASAQGSVTYQLQDSNGVTNNLTIDPLNQGSLSADLGSLGTREFDMSYSYDAALDLEIWSGHWEDNNGMEEEWEIWLLEDGTWLLFRTRYFDGELIDDYMSILLVL